MKTLSVLLLGILTAAACVAQEVPKAEVFAGYSFVRVNTGTVVNPFTTNGGLGSFQLNFGKHFGVVAEMGGYHSGQVNIGSESQQLDQTQYTFLFGPRVSFNKSGQVTPFFHYLVGGIHNSRSFSVPNDLLPPKYVVPPGVTVDAGTTSTRFRTTQTSFAMAIGGGIDIRLSRHLSFRPAQLDYLPSRFSPFDIPGLGTVNDENWQNNFRYATGFTFRFGGAQPLPPQASCTGTPGTLLPDDPPVEVQLKAADFNPKHSLSYSWTTTGGKVTPDGTSAKVDVTGLAPGNYTVTGTATDPKEKKLNKASCTASFTVKEPRPPIVACSASPSTINAGDPVTISANGSSPDDRAIKSRNFRASAGTLQEGQTSAGAEPNAWSSTATLDTASAQPGAINVTVGVTDVRGLSASCVASVNVNTPPPPVTVVEATYMDECGFITDAKRPARVDNACKAVLDQVSMRLQREPDGKLVIVGYQEEQEDAIMVDMASHRAVNAKAYLTSGEGQSQIDPSRIQALKGKPGDKKAKFYFLPPGATFTVEEATVIDETTIQVQPRNKPAPNKKASASAAVAGD